ncbi:MAG: hypothetical protein HYZ37_07650 [Candidatus Solibacter usitatus]|nr:hypothetical protein [Candidatus Solibacter usitatus]
MEGFVFDTDSTTRKPVRGIAVSLDGSRVAETDASGRFRFSEVAEGPHRVVLAIEQLPADFTPGLDPTPDTLVIKAGKITRQDFTVHRLSEIRGLVRGPQGLALDSIVLDLKPGARYTTPEVTGEFVFRDVVAGKYEVVVRPESLPPQTRLTTQAKWEVEVSRNTRPQVEFALEKVEVVVPVRRVLQNKVISVASPDLNRR